MRRSHAAGMEGAHAAEAPGSHDHEVHEHSGEGPFSMTAPVLVLAVLSVVGGWIQWAPFWDPVSKWLDPVAPPLAVPTDTQEALASFFAVLLGLAGIGVAWLIYGTRRWRVPRLAFSQRVLEHKFYFDERVRLRVLPAGRLSGERARPLDRRADHRRLGQGAGERGARSRPRYEPAADWASSAPTRLRSLRAWP